LECCQCRKARIQRNHIGYAFLVWVRLKGLAAQTGRTAYLFSNTACWMITSFSNSEIHLLTWFLRKSYPIILSAAQKIRPSSGLTSCANHDSRISHRPLNPSIVMIGR
jgi:hypothetical protein